MPHSAEHRRSPSTPLPTGLLADELASGAMAKLGPVVMADDPCEAAFSGADPTGPRKYYRARYYDPKVGRFISEDPIGFDGGINFYAYAAGNPARYRDPLGLYNKDVHYYKTKELALKAGFNPWQAEQIARGDQDMDDLREFSPWTSRANRRNHHFTTEARRRQMRNEACANKSWWQFGSYLHALQDSYSHQKGQTDREEPYGETIGHGWTPHPDRPEERPELYEKMLDDTRQELARFYQVIKDAGLADIRR